MHHLPTPLMHYLSLGVKQRLCARGAPIIVMVWIPPGSRVHPHSFVTAALLYKSGSDKK